MQTHLRSALINEDPSAFQQKRTQAFDTVRQLHTPIWVFDTDNARVVLANQAALELWQAETEDSLRIRNLADGMSPAVARRLRQYQQDFIQRDAVFVESWTLYPKGEPTTVMVVYSGYVLPDGRMAMMCEALHETKDLPENLRSTDALLHADVMVTLYEEDGPPVYHNPAARMSLRGDIGCFRDIFVDPEVYDDLQFALAEQGEQRIVAEVYTAQGQCWQGLSVKRCKDAATGKPAILVTAVDVSDLKTARDTARFLAERDPLTDCYNRLYLNEHLETLMRQGRAVGTGLLYFDLDRFKQINDSFGHDVGDQVLRTVAQRIHSDTAPGETLARLGGDEFVLLIEGAGSVEALLDRAESLGPILKAPIETAQARLQTSASIGAVLVTADIADWSEAMRRADIALYASKQAGRDRCCVFNAEMGRAVSERARLHTDLARAIRLDEFVLHYQPRIDLNSGKVVSVEALVRWNHPTRGLLAPGHFIPICEENGMIEALGELIIVKAGRQICDWHKSGLDIGVSINISPRQFQSDGLMEIIAAVAATPHFPHGKVELEITETVLVGDQPEIAQRLTAMKALGFQIAIDDFGTGYSNLAYISRFPLQCIKIDKSFVDQLPGSEPVISLILTLAEQIGAITVAEGVEENDQLLSLVHAGCQQVQGFLFSKPVPAKDVPAAIVRIETQHT